MVQVIHFFNKNYILNLSVAQKALDGQVFRLESFDIIRPCC
jgi:hypothetical protein